MICIIVSAAVRIESTKRRCRLSRFVLASSSVMPSTPFIGVRISWLMLARKSSFARCHCVGRPEPLLRLAVLLD